tara:strand:+ start:153 stop:320 length:168 start_codon:yes stop_codon:yes gene_type:complete
VRLLLHFSLAGVVENASLAGAVENQWAMLGFEDPAKTIGVVELVFLSYTAIAAAF